MTPDSDIFVVLTPYGRIDVDFPEDGGSTLASESPAAIEYLTGIMARNTNGHGISMDPQNMEPIDLVNFCQPPGSGIIVLPPAYYLMAAQEGDAQVLDAVGMAERARLTGQLSQALVKLRALPPGAALERVRLTQTIADLSRNINGKPSAFE